MGSGSDDCIYCSFFTITLTYNQYSAINDLHTFQFTVAHALGFSVSTSRILATDLNTGTITLNPYEVFLSFLLPTGHSTGTPLPIHQSIYSSLQTLFSLPNVILLQAHSRYMHAERTMQKIQLEPLPSNASQNCIRPRYQSPRNILVQGAC
jgi:hypothetical protein